MDTMLPDIVGTIVSAGPILEQARLEREAWEKKRQEEEHRRYEEQERREFDNRRWNKFCEYAANWDQRGRLRAFVEEIERRIAIQAGGEVGPEAATSLVWARDHVEALDPFRDGLVALFNGSRMSRAGREA
jgi:hypothetical protein